MLRPLLLAGAALGLASPAAVAQETSSGVLFGRVWSQSAGTGLGRAVVELRGTFTLRRVHTEQDGSYRFEDVPPGLHFVRALSLDHAPLEVAVGVPAGGEVALDLSLELRPIPLPPVTTTVTAPGLLFAGEEEPGGDRRDGPDEAEAELRALEASPGIAELGLATPGSNGGNPNPGDPSNLLYVRGAAYDLKLVLLDGAPVYAPFHLGGLVEAFPPDVLGFATLYAGGAPARYDGGLSYVLDLGLRPGESETVRMAGALDLLAAGLRIEAPLADGAVRSLFSGRTLHGAGYPAISGGNSLPYGYGDALARIDIRAGGAGTVSATGFWNRESVQLELGDSVTPVADARWGNLAGSLRYRGVVGGGALLLSVASGTFETRLPLSGDEVRLAEGSTRRSRFTADYARRSGELGFGLGMSYDLYRSDYLEQGGETVGPRAISSHGESAGAYSELLWRASPEIDLRFGLRADLFLPGTDLRMAPRLAVRWHVSDATRLTLAAGRFHQYVRTPESILAGELAGVPPLPDPILDEPTGGEPTGADAGAPGSSLAVAGASHLVLSLDSELEAGLFLGLEGYLKEFDGIPFEDAVRASGVDLWLHRNVGPVQGWLGYSIGWVWSRERGGDREDRFAGRMLLTGGLDAAIPGGFEAGLRIAYGAGLPFTPVPTTLDATAPLANGPAEEGDAPTGETDSGPPPPTLAGAPSGDYLRLDARLSRRWSTRLGERTINIVPYLRLLNALDRRDALFYYLDPERDLRPQALSSVPLLAVLGVEWAF